jgi:hypothetical protein
MAFLRKSKGLLERGYSTLHAGVSLLQHLWLLFLFHTIRLPLSQRGLAPQPSS